MSQFVPTTAASPAPIVASGAWAAGNAPLVSWPLSGKSLDQVAW